MNEATTKPSSVACGTGFTSDEATKAQEVKQGWYHMPCGKHGAPWQARVVLKINPPTMTACQHVRNGQGRLPSVEELVAISRQLGDL